MAQLADRVKTGAKRQHSSARAGELENIYW